MTEMPLNLSVTHIGNYQQILRAVTCGYCGSSHIANAACTCKERCPSPWCVIDPADDELDPLRAHP